MQRVHASDSMRRRPIGREEVDQRRLEWEQQSEAVNIVRRAGGVRPVTRASGGDHNRKPAYR